MNVVSWTKGVEDGAGMSDMIWMRGWLRGKSERVKRRVTGRNEENGGRGNRVAKEKDTMTTKRKVMVERGCRRKERQGNKEAGMKTWR